MTIQRRPSGVGIKAMELYVPNRYISQVDLEQHDGVSAGKYTIGLGQLEMGFCDDREDIYSFALTAVASLLKKYSISPTSIGRLEVGTETLLDKSKSVKSVLMQLFSPSGNTDIEGIDTVNACYGGTNALFNAINWIESSAWDGRDAIVVAGDIAIYDKGPARPTGGAGAIAMLIGPNAPLVFESGRRGSYMEHAYDFYKPNMANEYPVVDGHYSLECYSRALDGCYKAYTARSRNISGQQSYSGGGVVKNGFGKNRLKEDGDQQNGASESATAESHPTGDKTETNGATNGNSVQVSGHHQNGNGIVLESPTEFEQFDYMCFHTPNCKLVKKSYGRLLYNDFLAFPQDKRFKGVPEEFLAVSMKESLRNKEIEKAFVSLSAKQYAERSQPSNLAAARCGNMYTASLSAALLSLISNVSDDELYGKRIAMFSYGSGLASSIFSLRVTDNLTRIREAVNLKERLDARLIASPSYYEHALYLREQAYSKKDHKPLGDIESLLPGTYYLTNVDGMFRRTYSIKE